MFEKLKVKENPITIIIFLISAIIFFLAGGTDPENIRFLIFNYETLPQRCYGILTYAFVHLDWFYFIINMGILIFVGIWVERLIGSQKYLILVLSSILVGGIALLLEKIIGMGFGAGAAAILFYYCFALPWERELPFKLPNIVLPVALIIFFTLGIIFRWLPPLFHLYSYITGALVGIIFLGIYKSKIKLTIAFSIILLIFLLLFVRDSFEAVNRDDLAEIVARDTLVFSHEVPTEVSTRLGTYDALIIGETHDISGHQELLVSMLPGLYQEGYRYFLLEWHQADSWILNNYVQSSVPLQMSEMMDRVYGVFLEGVRKFNSELTDCEGFIVKAMDINWSSETFVSSLEEFAYRLENTEVLDDFVASVRAGDSYGRQFRSLENYLEDNRSEYIAQWGQSYWGILEDMIYAESRSRIVRSLPGFIGFQERHREEVMKDLVDKYLERAGRVVINTGSYHAQKEYRFGSPKEWLAEYLVDPDHPLSSGNVYSLRVVPAQGRMRFGGEIRLFSLEENSSPGELFFLMSELAGEELAFLSLDDEVFMENNIEVNYHRNQFNYPVKRHYDGFILLPSVEFIGYEPSI
ncbi:rhomboid family intramembrane serine protease [Natronospora cellulosivora (SeqCode)]